MLHARREGERESALEAGVCGTAALLLPGCLQWGPCVSVKAGERHFSRAVGYVLLVCAALDGSAHQLSQRGKQEVAWKLPRRKAAGLPVHRAHAVAREEAGHPFAYAH